MKLRFTKHDKLWSKLVRERDGQCLVCGRKPPYVLNAHHYLRRGVKATRLMPENGVTLCVHCHTFNSQFSAHQTPEAFKTWFRSHYPERASLIEEKERQHCSERQAIQEFIQLQNETPSF